MGTCMEIKASKLKDFQSMPTDIQRQLLETSEFISLPKGTTVFEENQNLDKLYCIKKGACKFSKTDKVGNEHVLRYLGEGEIMGKRSLFSNGGAKVTATTLTHTELCCLDKGILFQQIFKSPEFCQDLYKAMAEDINVNEQNQVIFGAGKTIKERLINLLLFLAFKFGITEDGKLKVRIKREDMASTLGTSQEYIINLLKKFKNLQLINIIKGEIYILSTERLENIAKKT